MEENLYNMQEISSYREGNRLEAKKAKGGIPNSMWETYSSFANTDGGIILLGVDEKKDGSFEVSGVQNADQMLKDFWNMVNNRQKINVNLLVEKDVTVEDYEGKKNNLYSCAPCRPTPSSCLCRSRSDVRLIPAQR